MRQSLTSLFASLSSPPEQGTYIAAKSKDFKWLRIAKSQAGAPAFFIKATIPRTKIIAPKVSLANIEITFNQDCEITLATGAKERGQFVSIACLTDNTTLQTYFIEVISGIADRFGTSPTPGDVLQGIKHLEELFAARLKPPKRTIHGLWGELFVMVTGRNSSELVRSWHVDSLEKYDFSDGATRIEIKTCSSLPRKHHFSLEQVTPPNGATVIVVSVIAPSTTGGVSVLDLADTIRTRIAKTPALVDKFNLALAESMGNSGQDIASIRYDYHHAKGSIRYYDSQNIPAVDRSLPPQVSGVHFEADLSLAKASPLKVVRAMGGLFANL